jgi:hypothetical protein
MDSQPTVFCVNLEQGLSENLSLTALGCGRYRAEESSIFSEINFGDVIEAEPSPDGGIRLVRVIEQSSLVTLRWLIPQGVAESEGLSQFLEKVTAVGGRWERALGGLLILHLPNASGFDAHSEFKQYTGCNGPGSECHASDNI